MLLAPHTVLYCAEHTPAKRHEGVARPFPASCCSSDDRWPHADVPAILPREVDGPKFHHFLISRPCENKVEACARSLSLAAISPLMINFTSLNHNTPRRFSLSLCATAADFLNCSFLPQEVSLRCFFAQYGPHHSKHSREDSRPLEPGVEVR